MKIKTKFQVVPEGSHVFTLSEPPTLLKTKTGLEKLNFPVTYGIGKSGKISLFLNHAGELLKAIGVEENEDGEFDFDENAIVGMMFTADVIHDIDDKGNKWPRYSNFQPIAWDAPSYGNQETLCSDATPGHITGDKGPETAKVINEKDVEWAE